MKFSYGWLKDLVRIKESPQKLAELLTKRAFEAQSVTKVENDFVLDIALPPNRVPDASGHLGMAREIAALTGTAVKIKNSKIKENKKVSAREYLRIHIQNTKLCRRYIGRVIQNITLADSPVWLCERLLVCGLRPINNVVDAANYIMLETGQPLHVFDLDKIEGGEIFIRSALENETMRTLDGQDIVLKSEDLIIADAKNPLALAGIKGGVKAEVDLKTRNLVLEAANFEGSAIRKTSKRIALRTDASYRFEHTIHPELASFAMERLAALLQELTNGMVLKGSIDIYSREWKQKPVYLDVSYADALIGFQISPKKYEHILKSIGCGVKKNRKGFLLTAPSFRTDLLIPEDFIEEVIRIYGYDAVLEKLPPAYIQPVEKNNIHQWLRFFKKLLMGFGFTEVYRYAFLGKREIEALKGSPDDYVQIENPVSPEFQYLQREPYESLFSFLKQHAKGKDAIQVFSIDKGFSQAKHSGGNGEPEYREEIYLTTVIFGKDFQGKEALYTLKGYIAELLESAGIDDHWFDSVFAEKTAYPHLQLFKNLHPYRRAEIKIGSETIGVFGEIHPDIIRAWKLEGRVFITEFLVKDLLRNANTEIEFQEIPKFPAIERDISILVFGYTRIEEVQGLIENTGGKLLEDVDFFDEYMGEGVPQSKRSLAFRLVFRDPKRTLEEKEVETEMKKILAALKEKDWETR